MPSHLSLGAKAREIKYLVAATLSRHYHPRGRAYSPCPPLAAVPRYRLQMALISAHRERNDRGGMERGNEGLRKLHRYMPSMSCALINHRSKRRLMEADDIYECRGRPRGKKERVESGLAVESEGIASFEKLVRVRMIFWPSDFRIVEESRLRVRARVCDFERTSGRGGEKKKRKTDTRTTRRVSRLYAGRSSGFKHSRVPTRDLMRSNRLARLRKSG